MSHHSPARSSASGPFSSSLFFLRVLCSLCAFPSPAHRVSFDTEVTGKRVSTGGGRWQSGTTPLHLLYSPLRVTCHFVGLLASVWEFSEHCLQSCNAFADNARFPDSATIGTVDVGKVAAIYSDYPSFNVFVPKIRATRLYKSWHTKKRRESNHPRHSFCTSDLYRCKNIRHLTD